jgi:hypothetical protein
MADKPRNTVTRILDLLMDGHPVKLGEQTWYLGSNNELGVKMDRYLVDDSGEMRKTESDPDVIHCAEWSLAQFISVCEKLTPEELKKICDSIVLEDENILEVRSSEPLFRKGKELGYDIGEILAVIVQNDVYIQKEELQEWVQKIQKKVYEIIAHSETVVNYIENKLWPANKDRNTPVNLDWMDVLAKDDENPF